MLVALRGYANFGHATSFASKLLFLKFSTFFSQYLNNHPIELLGGLQCDPVGSLTPDPSRTTGLCQCKVSSEFILKCRENYFWLAFLACI